MRLWRRSPRSALPKPSDTALTAASWSDATDWPKRHATWPCRRYNSSNDSPSPLAARRMRSASVPRAVPVAETGRATEFICTSYRLRTDDLEGELLGDDNPSPLPFFYLNSRFSCHYAGLFPKRKSRVLLRRVDSRGSRGHLRPKSGPQRAGVAWRA